MNWKYSAVVIASISFLILLGTLHSTLRSVEVGADFVPETAGAPIQDNPDARESYDWLNLRYVYIGFALFFSFFVLLGMIISAIQGDWSLFTDLIYKIVSSVFLVIILVLSIQLIQVMNENDGWLSGGGSFVEALPIGGNKLAGGPMEALSNSMPLIAIILMVILIVAVIIFVVVTIIIPTIDVVDQLTDDEELVRRKRVLNVLAKSVDDLREGMDVRKAIIYCYLQMEAVVEQKGKFDGQNMTPREFKNEVGEIFGVGGEPLEDLVRLFEEARYSTHQLTEDDREEAIGALSSFRLALEGKK